MFPFRKASKRTLSTRTESADDASRIPPQRSGRPSQASVLPGEEFQALRGKLHGDLYLPGDDEWDSARSPWQLLVDQRPAAVADVADPYDIVLTIREAQRLGLAVAPQSTGHGAETLNCQGAILLRTARLNTITIDPESGTAHVGAGTTAGALAAAAQEHGFAAVLGMAPSVGVTGMTLGGGLGWLARSHGLAANSVIGIEGIDANGEVVYADAAHDADPFWAMRGGVAPIVVTSLTVQLHRLPALHAGALMWPIAATTQIVGAWRAWIADLPESVTSLVRVLRLPPLPDIPEPLRGQAFVAIEAALQTEPAETNRLLAPLRDLHPVMDNMRAMKPAELASVHGDPVDPAPAFGRSVLLSSITPETIDAFIAASLADTSHALLSVELRHLGGALAPGRTPGGAVCEVDGAGLAYCVGIVPAPQAAPVVHAAADAIAEALSPFASTTVVKNFTERAVPAESLYGAATGKLREVAAVWDPDGVIRLSHPLDA